MLSISEPCRSIGGNTVPFESNILDSNEDDLEDGSNKGNTVPRLKAQVAASVIRNEPVPAESKNHYEK